MGEMITFASDGATATGYLAVPAPDKARGRGVVVIQEWWGLVDHIKRVADRFATEGFHALAPDLYHGTTTRLARRGGQAPHGPQHRAGREGPARRDRAPALRDRPPRRAPSASAWGAPSACSPPAPTRRTSPPAWSTTAATRRSSSTSIA